MKKKALSLALALVMCLGLTVPAFAVDFTQSGVTVLPEPPKGAVDFSFVCYQGSVPVAEAVYSQEQGKFYVESCTAVPAEQAGYQTITLKVRAEIFTTEDKESGVKLGSYYWNNSLYDYYTGEQFKLDSLSGDAISGKVKDVTYGGVTYPIKYMAENRWVHGEKVYDAENEREIQSHTCYKTVTVTAPETYDGMVFALIDRYKADTSTSGATKVNTYFRFGPKATFQATPTNDSLTCNGKAQYPTVYKINGSNYFKIRDLAAILNGTGKQFSVGYDSALKSVTATTGEGYSRLNGDLSGAATSAQNAEISNDTIYVNGQKVQAEVYKIGGSNYFKLRDLGKALNFYVGWSQEQGMFIETDKPYSE